MRMLSLFSGIGAFEKALTNLKYNFSLVGYSEIDRFASRSYSAIHGVSENLNLGDVSAIAEVPDFDLMTFGFPCTDISVAGRQLGMVEGTRSNLYREALRILEMKRPKYSVFENVKNLVGKAFKPDFDRILQELSNLGYTNYWKVLNAKDYGVPQNRERVFVISILGEHTPPIWPTPFDNGLRLMDFLETEVDEKHFLSGDKVQKLIDKLDLTQFKGLLTGGKYNQNEGFAVDDISRTLDASQYKGLGGNQNRTAVAVLTPERAEKRQNGRRFKTEGEPMFTLTGQDRHGVMQIGNIVDTGNFENSQRGRIYDPAGVSPTLNTCTGGGFTPKVVLIDDCCPTIRIRRLTAVECFRLMGFSDLDIDKCRLIQGISDCQLYKQSGNSIVVDVLMEIFKGVDWWG